MQFGVFITPSINLISTANFFARKLLNQMGSSDFSFSIFVVIPLAVKCGLHFSMWRKKIYFFFKGKNSLSYQVLDFFLIVTCLSEQSMSDNRFLLTDLLQMRW